MRRPRIGLASVAALPRGWVHIGVFYAFAETGVEPDIVCGTSIGSLIGAVFAGRLTELRFGHRKRPGAGLPACWISGFRAAD